MLSDPVSVKRFHQFPGMKPERDDFGTEVAEILLKTDTVLTIFAYVG